MKRAVPQNLLGPGLTVCVGCGGVGKTTVAAALALEAARTGRRALVLTIDPARRLADALGVEALDNEPRALPRARLDALGVPPEGCLHAVMLDMKRTFDDLVERFAESSDARERILGNPIYQHISETLAGSVEYSAMEKVYDLWQNDDYDVVIVDTPPAQHALDFLEAPQRLIELLESRVVQMLIHPAFAAGRFGFRLFQQGTRRVLQALERVSGLSFLEDVSEFLLAFEGMSPEFRARANEVRGVLLGPQASYVLVTGPARASVRQALDFRGRLSDYGVTLAGVIANRVHSWPGTDELHEPPPNLDASAADLSALAEALASTGAPQRAAEATLAVASDYAAVVRRDGRALRELRKAATGAGGFWAVIPELPEDVHDLDGLARMAAAVFGNATT
ncbi:MAG: ArsA family ATPase [Deltaproteobacteria bacterium]|nr:ArsA family ATPase [Deltaproteobacteria bacterium]